MAEPSPPSNAFSVILRVALPLAILAGGWYGFSTLTSGIEEKPVPKKEKRTLKTQVVDLQARDYPVVIRTHAVVQPHNRVTLAAEIAGAVTKVSPSFETGAYFAKGEVLVEIDSRNFKTALAIAESRLRAAKSELKLAKLNEERKLRLIKSNAVSQAEVEVASASREQAEANVDLALTEVEQAEHNVARTKVVAPFDGRVENKMIGLGQMASPNAPLGEIFAIDFAEVRLPISAEQRQFLTLPEFANDSPITATLHDAINETSDEVWNAKIVRTEGVLDQNSRDLFAIARVDDPFGRNSEQKPLRIAQPVVARIEGLVLKNVIALPRSSVRQLDQIVLVDQKEQTLLPMTIKSVWADAEYVIVRSDAIPQGMWLATTPMSYTPKGAKVEIIPNSYPTASVAESTSTSDSTTN